MAALHLHVLWCVMFYRSSKTRFILCCQSISISRRQSLQVTERLHVMVQVYLADSALRWINNPVLVGIDIHHTWVLVQQIVIIVLPAKWTLFLVLRHELVLHLAHRVERFIVLVCHVALSLLVTVCDLDFQSTSSFTEVLVLWRHIVTCCVLISRVDDAFEVGAGPTVLLYHLWWVTCGWEVSVRTFACFEDGLHEILRVLRAQLSVLELELVHV